MVFNFDIFGGSRRRAALQVLDRTLTDLEVNPAYMDDGMRYAIYNWALAEEERGQARRSLDELMRDAAAMISFCVLGPRETEAMWGAAVLAAREARFNAVLANVDDDSFDARLIKLVLAKGNAAADIRARVELE